MKALYVIDFILGDDAPSQRVRAITKLLERAGCSVDCVCTGVRPRTDQKIRVEPAIHFDEKLAFGKTQIFSKYHERLTWSKSIKFLDSVVNAVNPDVFITYGIGYPLMDHIVKLANSKSKIVIPDETDDFDIRFNGNIANYIDDISRKKSRELLHPCVDGVIAISPYFESMFEGIGVPSFFLPSVVPHLMDLPVERTTKLDDGSLRFIYAGSLGGGKDLIQPFIEAMFKLQEAHLQRQICLDVIGPTVDEVQSLCSFSVCDVRNLKIHGKRTHEFVIDALLSADFGLLLRKPEKYAVAGFSTKFGECMSLGVPMFCNVVGGADSILEDGYDGILINDFEVNSIADRLIDLSCCETSSLVEMRIAARSKAESIFNVDSYVSSFGDFLQGLVRDKESGGKN